MQTLKLNCKAAKYEAHPLFHYLVKECTLEEACRLLREGLVEEFAEARVAGLAALGGPVHVCVWVEV